MSGSNVENLSPQIYPQVLRLVSKQLSDLVKDPPEGIKVLVNDEDITCFSAVIDGPAGTPYFGGCFHVRCNLSKDFPVSPPKAFFTTKIFHPNVSRDGEICVNTLKKDWKPDLGLKHILLTIKCLLIVPNPESALNEEAGKLLLEHYDDYCRRAKMMTDIHARSHTLMKECDSNKASSSSSSTTTEVTGETEEPCSSRNELGSHAKKRATGEKVSKSSSSSSSSSSGNQNKPSNVRDKRRTLKRL